MRHARAQSFEPHLRASDGDRERVAAFLRDHCSEGRLTAAELSDRVEKAYAAVTLSHLEELVRDLPGSPFPVAGPPSSGRPPRSSRRGRALTYAVVGLIVAATITGLVPALTWAAFGLSIALGVILLALGLALAPFAALVGAAVWALRRWRTPLKLGRTGLGWPV